MRALWTAVLLVLTAAPAFGQTVSGRIFEDRNGNGIRDANEPFLEGVEVQLYGSRDAGGSFEQLVTTATDGSFSFSPGDGCYLLRVRDPEGWRISVTRSDGFNENTPGYDFPIGEPRFAKLDQGIDHLKSGSVRFTAMGDSIAWNWNSCFFPESFWYSKQVRSRLACTSPSASVDLDDAAVKGEDTDDLLVDDNDDLNNVFRVIEIQPELITISMIGNDLLGVDPDNNPPSQEEINAAAEELLDSRQNLQEAISAMISEIPGADVALNTLYDNEAYNCDSIPASDFHREWLPIASRVLRELAWGQVRRMSISEVAAEFAHEDQASNCFGFEGKICRDALQTDLIHPNNSGYTIIREKVWEATGGVNLGSRDALARSSIGDVNYGYLRRLRRLRPSSYEVRNGASVSNPEAAFDEQDGGLAAQITLGIVDEEFRLFGFPDWFDELQIVKVIAEIRYRTSGTVQDDYYRMEASVTGQFRPGPGFNYTTTNWNFYTPIVGGGGPNKPDSNPDFPDAELLVLPNVSSYREVSATLTKNPVLPQGASDYQWPPVTHEDLSTTSIRVVAAPVAGTPGIDDYQVELDGAWLELYGWEKARPQEVQNLKLDRLQDGKLEVSFDVLEGSQRYNLYFGRLFSLGDYDHGTGAPAGPFCGASTEDAGAGRLKIVVSPEDQPLEDSYVLVTAHVDDVESPSGKSSDGVEIDRSQSICR